MFEIRINVLVEDNKTIASDALIYSRIGKRGRRRLEDLVCQLTAWRGG